jgi:nanoRNase/pAp phosphatase (c-di-AMP/oligoRNAs hydrolase)
MSSESITQTINLLKQAQNILILPASSTNLDAVASSLAVKEFLSRLEKTAKVLTLSPVSKKFSFLPGVNEAGPAVELSKNLLIEIKLDKTDLSELNYQKSKDKLEIFVSPKSGDLESSDVAVKPGVYPFDAILTLGIGSLESLGQFYERHASMFFEIPVVNIDNSPGNENFGQINLVSLVAGALSEIVFDLLTGYDLNLITDRVATLLLAGLVGQTNSFQNLKTSPAVFDKASKLVSMGAKQQEIISSLYRSKSLPLLRLWGRVLARLKHNEALQIVSSEISRQDLEKSEALDLDLSEIIFEMQQQLSFAKTFLVFAEIVAGRTTVYFASSKALEPQTLLAAYNPKIIGFQASRFDVDKPLNLAEPEILDLVEKNLAFPPFKLV